jgi:hypothetical protein
MLYNDRHPNGPDPEKYILIVTKQGKYWRKKRGSVKKAELNDSFRTNSNLLKVTAPAASRIMGKLRYYTDRLDMGCITARISGALRKQMSATGHAGISCLRDMDLQPNDPLRALLTTWYSVSQANGILEVAIPIRDYTIKRHNKIVSHYFFELVLLYGDCMEADNLRTEDISSGVYSIDQHGCECRMQMVLPEKE